MKSALCQNIHLWWCYGQVHVNTIVKKRYVLVLGENISIIFEYALLTIGVFLVVAVALYVFGSDLMNVFKTGGSF